MARRRTFGSLDLNLLRTFLSVVDHGSLRKAAEAVDRTQSALSQRIVHLEKIVGQKLLRRSRNGVKLTRHGELLVTYANRAVELHEEILLEFREKDSLEEVILGASTELALTGLTPVLERFRAIHSHVTLRVVITTADGLGVLLKERQVDLAIAQPRLIMKMPPTAKWLVPLEWVARKDLSVDHSGPLPLVVLEGACLAQDEVLDALRRAGWTWRVAVERSSLFSILNAARAGLGVAALPAEAKRNAKLVTVDAALPVIPKLEFGIFPGTPLARAAQTLVDLIMASISCSSSYESLTEPSRTALRSSSAYTATEPEQHRLDSRTTGAFDETPSSLIAEY